MRAVAPQTSAQMAAVPCRTPQAGGRSAVHCAAALNGMPKKNALAQPPVARPLGQTSHKASRMLTFQVMAAAQAEVGKLISKVEIPAFIPRQDLMDQLLRWAHMTIQEGGVAAVGCPTKVTPFLREGGLWGFTVSFLKDGVTATDVRVAFDEEVAVKHEWVGVGADGFPSLEGNEEQIMGKHFEVRKVDETPVTEDIRASIRDFCTLLVAAINKYYAFGSCFVDDAQ